MIRRTPLKRRHLRVVASGRAEMQALTAPLGGPMGSPFPKVRERPPIEPPPRGLAPRREDPRYRAFVRSQPCMWNVTGAKPCWGPMDAHHDPTKGSGRWDDRLTVPCCRGHHGEIDSGKVQPFDVATTEKLILLEQLKLLRAYSDG